MKKKKSLVWQNCSEEELRERVRELAPDLGRPGTLVLLEGPMGAGKSSLARALIEVCVGSSMACGSPTFPIAQMYQATAGFQILHMDLYRMKSEEELFHSGVAEQMDSENALVLVEWASLFPEFFAPYLDSHASHRTIVRIEIKNESQESRDYRFEWLRTQVRS